jgi:hypothetical protein
VCVADLRANFSDSAGPFTSFDPVGFAIFASRSSLQAHPEGSRSHYARDPNTLAEYPPADIELAKIGDLLACDLSTFLKEHGSSERS